MFFSILFISNTTMSSNKILIQNLHDINYETISCTACTFNTEGVGMLWANAPPPPQKK